MDPEKGLVSATARSMIPSSTSSAPDHAINDGSSRHTPLQLFQLLVGIHTPPSLTTDGIDVGRNPEARSGRARSDNIGLYQRAKDQERASRIAYLCTSTISNTLYMLQILFAAAFTAMSAYKDTHVVTLMVLGAVNTVLAGCLAWQKGMGVPQRYRKAQDQYRALIFEIEMAERSFLDIESFNSVGGNDNRLDPRAEKDRLQKLFDTARADQQANYPDLYVSTGTIAAGDATKELTKQLEDAKAETAKMQSELMAKIEALTSRLEGQVVAAADNAIQSIAKA